MKGVHILSGGMDSATLLYLLQEEGHELRCLTFDYGQRHRREIASAEAIARSLAMPHQVIDLTAVGGVLTGSALTDEVPVPHGHYAAENMKLTVVPNRNAIMLAIAWGVAIASRADFVSYAAHAGDHFIYPDCRPHFVGAVEHAFKAATEGFGGETLALQVPFLHLTKGEIAYEGLRLGVPFELTWSCYEGGEVHCGKCGACVERKEAFEVAGAPDPVRYAS